MLSNTNSDFSGDVGGASAATAGIRAILHAVPGRGERGYIYIYIYIYVSLHIVYSRSLSLSLSLYVYIYIYMYHIYIYIYIYLCISLSLYIYIYIYIYISRGHLSPGPVRRMCRVDDELPIHPAPNKNQHDM